MLAMAAVLATLEAIEDDGMLANAERRRAPSRTDRRDARRRAVHGKGCLLGIEFEHNLFGGPCESPFTKNHHGHFERPEGFASASAAVRDA